jgi:hypothetical protein
MAQTGRSNVRYVDPQRRYTVVLGLSWNAPFGALPHDDRAGTHDSADGRCGSYASTGRGQAALWITSKIFVAVCSPLESGTSAAPPRSVMNSRRFNASASRASHRAGVLHCGISGPSVSALCHVWTYMDPARLQQTDWIGCNSHNC